MFNIFCMDLDDPNLEFMLYNDQSEMQNKHIDFQVEMCRNDTSFASCKSKKEIEDFLADVTIDVWVMEHRLNMQKVGQDPVFREQRIIMQDLLVPRRPNEAVPHPNIYIKENKYIFEDSIFQMVNPLTFEGDFYSVLNVVNRPQAQSINPNLLFKSELYMDPLSVQINRTVYDLSMLMSDLGGVVNVLLAVFGIVLYPLSQHLYYLKSAQRMYLARTKDKNLLEKPSDKNTSQQDEQILWYID